MKIIIHCPPNSVAPEEKKRFLQRIQSFRIPIEKNEVKDRTQFLYFVRGQFKYSRCDLALIEVVEKIKEQTMAKKGRWEGPWDILELDGNYSITLLDEKTQEEKVEILQPPVFPPQSITVVEKMEKIEKMEDKPNYHPTIDFVNWNFKMKRVNREYLKYTPFPVWLYNIRNVHSELGKTDWLFMPTERYL